MKTPLLVWMLLVTAFVSCKKGNHSEPSLADTVTRQQPVAPAIGRGSISGKVSPADAVATIAAYVDGQGMPYTTSAMVNGTFSLKDLPEGNYTLYYHTKIEYSAGSPIKVYVTAGKNTELPTAEFTNTSNYGSVSGVISPVSAVRYVSLIGTAIGSTSTNAYPDVKTGVITFPKLPAGTYKINYIQAEGYKPISTTAITVNGGQNTDLGRLNFVADDIITGLSCNVSNVFKSWNTYAGGPTSSINITTSANYASPLLNISGSRRISGIIAVTNAITIKLNGVTGPGTFVCSPATSSEIIYSISSIVNGSGPAFWSSKNAGGNALVTITSIDPATQIVTGSFSGSLVQVPGAGSTSAVTLSDGQFNMAYH